LFFLLTAPPFRCMVFNTYKIIEIVNIRLNLKNQIIFILKSKI